MTEIALDRVPVQNDHADMCLHFWRASAVRAQGQAPSYYGCAVSMTGYLPSGYVQLFPAAATEAKIGVSCQNMVNKPAVCPSLAGKWLCLRITSISRCLAPSRDCCTSCKNCNVFRCRFFTHVGSVLALWRIEFVPCTICTGTCSPGQA